MKIGIIGLGYVGTAVFKTHSTHSVIVRDPKLENKSATIEQIKNCDGIYVCVPTPMESSGSCNTTYVESVLEELIGYDNVIICKSTLPPGKYKELNLKYPNLVHAPEFLTAANADKDYENSAWVLIGGHEPYVEMARKIISSSSIKATEYHVTNIETASLFKYLANTFLSTKVIFMNELYHLAKKLDINWNEIIQISNFDPRLGGSHWQVPGPDGQFGYGGACFPKDVSALIEHAKDIGIQLNLLEKVKNINQSLRDDLI